MPASRTKRTVKRESSLEGVQLNWETPAPSSSSPSRGIAFATNLTPVTFNDPPASDEADSQQPIRFESFLFPPKEEGKDATPSTPRKAGHSKKKPDNHIPRPPNAFILFRSSFIKSQHVSSDVETNHSTLSKIIGLTWQNLPPDERSVWHAKARTALADHRKRFPEYTFRPAHNKKAASSGSGDKPEKRKVREVGPKDLKRCQKIAELLVEGLKGEELDVAIQEFDKTHVPEVVTRFETPLTARAYRRSSSVSIVEAENDRERKNSIVSAAIRHARSSSSGPSQNSVSTSNDLPPLQPAFDPLTYSGPSSAVDPFSTFSISEPSIDFSSFSFDQPSSSCFSETTCSPLIDYCLDPTSPSTKQFHADEWSPSTTPYPTTPTDPSSVSFAGAMSYQAPPAPLDEFWDLPPLVDYPVPAESHTLTHPFNGDNCMPIHNSDPYTFDCQALGPAPAYSTYSGSESDMCFKQQNIGVPHLSVNFSFIPAMSPYGA